MDDLFDPIFPDDLAKLHPMPCDEDTKFQEAGHRYGVRLADGTWTTENLLSTTSWVKRYVRPGKDDEFSKIAMNIATSLNKRFKRESHAYPVDLYDMIDEKDWVAAYQSTILRAAPTADAFRHLIESNPAKHVRLPYYKDTDSELRLKFQTWKSGDDVSKTTVDWFKECFGDYEPRVIAAPPYLTGNDVRDLWPRFGTRLHYDIEHFLNGHPPTFTHAYADWQQFLRFYQTEIVAKGYVPFRTELTMSVPALRVCGQADFVARKPNGKYVMYDWKRTNKIRSDGRDLYLSSAKPLLPPWDHRNDSQRDTYTIQQNVYRQMMKTYDIDIDEMYLVTFHRVLPDYQLIPVPCMMAGDDASLDGRALKRMVLDRKLELEEQSKLVRETHNDATWTDATAS